MWVFRVFSCSTYQAPYIVFSCNITCVTAFLYRSRTSLTKSNESAYIIISCYISSYMAIFNRNSPS